ncbi:uncharacterized protein LOC141505173 [Macrotis lagotis]|uniref:uncharacterized protein LOC141505173 n=1 Tax=Macrotis lagotis TaxID=92651 RepID=UPI003D68D78F
MEVNGPMKESLASMICFKPNPGIPGIPGPGSNSKQTGTLGAPQIPMVPTIPSVPRSGGNAPCYEPINLFSGAGLVLWNRVCGIFIPDSLKETHGVILVYLSNQTRIGLERGRELSEVKTEFFILFKLSEERKKYLMHSITVQQKVDCAEILKGEAINNETTTIEWLWNTREWEIKCEELMLTKRMEKEEERHIQELKALCVKGKDLEKKIEKYLNATEINTVPKSSIEEQQNKLMVEEEISRVKPTLIRKKRKHSWFQNIKGCNFLSFFRFQNHDKQLNNIHMKEENEEKVPKSSIEEQQNKLTVEEEEEEEEEISGVKPTIKRGLQFPRMASGKKRCQTHELWRRPTKIHFYLSLTTVAERKEQRI